MDIINKLRLNSQATIVSISSSLDGTITTTDGQEPLDNELYLQTMATCNRNWEIPRDRITITHEKLGGGEFGLVNKGHYLRIDGQQLAVAVKRLKGKCCIALKLSEQPFDKFFPRSAKLMILYMTANP